MITSTANQQVKLLMQLNKKGKIRDAKDLFVAEGPKMLREAPGDRLEKVYCSESFFEKYGKDPALKEVPYEVVQDSVFRAMSDTQNPQGVLCLVRQYHYTLEDLLLKEKPLLLILENLQDPGNLGTILRTGEGAGITGVIMSKKTVDIYNPKTIRSTMGSIYRVPFLYVEDMEGTIRILREKGIRVYAAHLRGQDYYSGFSFVEGTAFLIGNEGNGLRRETADLADCYLKIPMEGQVESLNAAIAASLLVYEAHRQRNS